MSVFLNDFQIVNPKNCVSQSDALKWIVKCHQVAEKQNSSSMDLQTLEKLFHRYAVKSSQISQRYCESDDIFSGDFEKNQIYKIDSQHLNGVDIEKRGEFFSERALKVLKSFYGPTPNSSRPDHLIHVTCTGYTSPSAAQKIVTEQYWDHLTDVTHAYHMGCYASLPAIRLAKALVDSEGKQNPNYKADVVHTEMCGLHMNPLIQTPEQMVIQTLFADGHIKYSATLKKNEIGQNLKIIAVLENILPNSQTDMSWTPAAWGMKMNLSREVPAKIQQEIKKFSQKLFHKANLSNSEALGSVFAIHPGGPKIIDSVQQVLELKESQVLESKKVLFERGNMSSATLPHVWNEVLNNKYPVGTKVVSFAFGPGLTLFGAVFEIC